uniref:C-Jun-amino-terminal kinase-interacting protein 4 n=1 Tax=Phallusia mammillata TaxID=59560 RepID=A0A6F9DU21_9ASCI|nr:C-Jun-amino-terminal kinase-interacting protein 4 [Phallusia mammillata]
MSVESEIVYGSNDAKTGLSSEKLPSPELPVQVQAMASSVYGEFKRMMSLYGEDVIKDLMPLIVTILETLDRSMTECNENIVEIEMLKDDNEQLATQYERERQLRRSAEQRLMETEDVNETATRDIRDRADALETATRHLELKCKNYTDQVERLQERESDLKKEYTQLHDRHTEMIQSYMEHIEKTKTLQHQSSYSDVSQSPHQNNFVHWYRRELTPSLTTPSGDSPGFRGFNSDATKKTPSSPVVSGNPDLTSTPSCDRSLMSIKDEIPKSMPISPSSPSSSNDRMSPGHDLTGQHIEIMDVGSPSGESDGVGWVSEEVKEILQNGELELDRPDPDGNEDSETQKALESTGIENAAFETTQTTNASSLFAEMSQQDLGDVDEGADILALYDASKAFPGDMQQDMELCSYLGMSKEVENLIQENSKLLATKNALNVVKDDLIQKVDQLTTQHALLKEELNSSEKGRKELQDKHKELEKQLLRVQQELENVAVGSARNSISKQSDEEDVVPLSQRKRFTRVEMARVLMERNQYKERLMELQEAVRWTETLRASRNNADVTQNKNKNKSSIFQFFSRLFTSNTNGESTNQQPSPEPPRQLRRTTATSEYGLNVAYNVPTSKVIPRSRSSTASLYGKSPTIDNLREAAALKLQTKKNMLLNITEDYGMLRQTPTVSFVVDSATKKSPNKEAPRRESPRLSENTRLQACGWSLPNTPATPKEGSRTVPVPVYCGPIQDQETNMKVWCATSVNVANAKTRNGGSVVGTGSVFYREQSNTKDESGIQDVVEHQSKDVVQLSEELESKKHKIRTDSERRESVSSYVWLVSDDSRTNPNAKGSVISVVDARQPNHCIENFPVGSSETHILCITSAPGAIEEDYLSPDEEEADSMYTSAGDTSMLGMTQSPTEATNDTMPTIDATNVEKSKGSKDEPAFDYSPPDKEIGGLEKVQTPTFDVNTSSDQIEVNDDTVKTEKAESVRIASIQPTMWIGSQNGCIFVHSAINNWSKCLHKIRLKDSVLAIVHLKGRAFAGLADGTVAIFRRDSDGIWDLSNYYLLDLGRPHHSIRCMTVVYDRVWCGYRNRIHIVEPKSMKIESTFNAHPRRESQVRQLAWAGDGVWVSIRLDSTVRLYHARTQQHLQDVDIEPYVSKVLGSGKLGFSFVRITSLMVAKHRLWIGTGNGVVMSVPLSEGSKGGCYSNAVMSTSIKNAERPGGVIRVYSDPVSDKLTPGTFIPYCSMANAQLSFHGYRDAVKFFVSVPGCVTQSSPCVHTTYGASPTKLNSQTENEGTLVISGGEGYVDFRMGDLGAISPNDKRTEHSTLQNSHIIVWQLTSS